ncbi:MAG: response regulator transcription factor [Anaerolineaceae bacterium]|nr:response regulator transcription factor [Anaerolineaceae bacterium]
MTQSENNAIRILLVDDSDTFREITLQFLNRYPELEVVGAAADADEALDLTRDLSPHVVLLDLDMPGKTGFEVLPLLKETDSTCKVVILSLMEGSSYTRIAKENGADGFVTKHQLITKLIPMIYKVMNDKENRLEKNF